MGKRGGFIATPRAIVTSDLLADVRDYVRRCANLQVFEKKMLELRLVKPRFMFNAMTVKS